MFLLPQFYHPYAKLQPYVVEGRNFLLVKNGNLVFRSWAQASRTQLWSHVPSLGFRFGDRVLATEYMNFLDSQLTAPKGVTAICEVDALPDVLPRPRVTGYAQPEEQRSDIARWLTTYSGVIGK